MGIGEFSIPIGNGCIVREESKMCFVANLFTCSCPFLISLLIVDTLCRREGLVGVAARSCLQLHISIMVHVTATMSMPTRSSNEG